MNDGFESFISDLKTSSMLAAYPHAGSNLRIEF